MNQVLTGSRMRRDDWVGCISVSFSPWRPWPVFPVRQAALRGAVAAGRMAELFEGLLGQGQAVALLTTLMLRGPQTPAELRLNCERLHRFADISSVEAFLDELASKTPPRAVRLARAPGEREARWAHLLCGEPAQTSEGRPPVTDAVDASSLDEMRAELARQAAELLALRAELSQLRAQLQNELGLSAPTSEIPDAI